MYALLVPISLPDTETIPVKDELLAIGRIEPPFNSMPNESVMQLSRRHARIFEEQGRLYLVDLGSRNGTRLNGERLVDQPQRLKHGDQIVFGNLAYHLQDDTERTDLTSPPAAEWQLVLVPRAEQFQTTIVITEFPCLMSKTTGVIAKYCAHFNINDQHLSRRHAHVFIRKNQLWLEDLGSTNGTYVNDQALGDQPHALRDGDRIQFGKDDEFVFLATVRQFSAGNATTEYLDEPTLIGIPSANTRALKALQTGTVEPAAPATNQTDAAAAQAELANAALPDSRQSAADVPLTSEPETDNVVSIAPEPSAPAPVQHTILLDKANTFLDIFCDEPPPVEPSASEDEPAKADKGDESKSGEPRNWFTALVLSDDSKRNKRALAGGLVALVLIAVGSFAINFFITRDPENQAHWYYDNAQYQEALRQADSVLSADPDNESLRRLALSASVRWLVPTWLELLDSGDLDQAQALLADLPAWAASTGEIDRVVFLLQWATELELLVADMSGGQHVEIFGNEDQIRDVLSQWDQNPQVNQHYFGLMAQHIPEFKSIRMLLMSHLRRLKSSQSVYLQAIERLKQDFDRALEDDKLDVAADLLDEFARKYSSIKGTEKLRQDFDTYRRMVAALDARQLLPLAQMRADYAFSTPLLEQHATRKVDAELPDDQVLERYRAAQRAWRNGELIEAMNAINALREQPWGDVAQAWSAHYEAVINGYDKLLAASGSDAYPAQLMKFYGLLDQEEDRYYIEKLQPELAPIKKMIRGEVARDRQQAEAAWRRYRNHGGIMGRLRLEGSVSSQYRQRAAELSEAYEFAERATMRAGWLEANSAAAETALLAALQAEVRQQHHALSDLRNVLGSALVEQKQVLLPSVPE